MTIGASLSLFLLVPLLSSAVAAVVPSLLVRRFLMLAVPLAGVIGSVQTRPLSETLRWMYEA